MKNQYNKTIAACFVGYIVQAVVNNFAPLLFLFFHNSYHVPLSQITLLVTFNFSCFDGYRPYIIGCGTGASYRTAGCISDFFWGKIHSFYCWGHAGVVFLSTLFFYVAGIGNWKILALGGDIGCSGGPAQASFCKC